MTTLSGLLHVNPFFKDDDDGDEDLTERSGRVTFDDRGNAVWNTGQHKLLIHPKLALVDDEGSPQGREPGVQNKIGMKRGYNPYESGLLKGGRKDGFRKKKNLAALSKWIQLKKNMDGKDE